MGKGKNQAKSLALACHIEAFTESWGGFIRHKGDRPNVRMGGESMIAHSIDYTHQLYYR